MVKQPIKLIPKEKRTALLKVVAELREYDHAFLTPKGVAKFSEPFGFTAKTYLTKANPTDPKGLTLDNGATEAYGRDACSLAMEICDHLEVKYDEKFGRGSQLRVCCDALEEHLKRGAD